MVIRQENKAFPGRVKIGNWLKKNIPPGSWMAISRCGLIPYYSGLPTIDMLGLNDRHIARTRPSGMEHLPGHEKHDFRYVLDRRPELIFYWDILFDKPPTNLGFHRVLPGFIGFQELVDPELMKKFQDEYVFRIAQVEGGYFTFFLRKDLIKKETP